MKKVFLAVVFSMFLAASAFAQGGAPASSGVQHFSVSASAVPWASTSTAPGTVEGGSLALTNRLSLGFQRIDLSPATYDMGLVEYTMPLKTLVGKTISSKFTFDPTKYSVTFFGGAGLIRQTSTAGVQLQEIAETVGMGLNYTADNHITVQIISGQWLHHTGSNLFLVTPDAASLQSGLKISF